MQLEFISDLCAKIELPAAAQTCAFAVLTKQSKQIERLLKQKQPRAIAACTRALRWHRARGAAFSLAFALAAAEQAFHRYASLGIPESIYYASMRDISIWVRTAAREEQIDGLCEIAWIQHTLYLQLFRIGRLQYQFFTTNHTVSGLSLQARKTLPVASGVPVLNVHIPQDGKLDYAACVASFDAAEVFFAQFFPKYTYAGFVCDSWLLDANNRAFMAPESNILRFADLFDCVVQTTAQHSELPRRLWGKAQVSRLAWDNLAEDTTLQRAAKAYLRDGGKTGNGYGFRAKREQS